MDSAQISSLLLPVAAGAGVIGLTLFLRWYLYSFIHKLASKTKTVFDDILIHETRLPSLFWCLWLGIFVGYKLALTPDTWVNIENKVMSTLFISLGIYTAVAVVMAILKWYRDEICPKTTSNVDDFIMSALIKSVPVISTLLGIIWILRVIGIEINAIDSWLSQHLASLAGITVLSMVLLLATMAAVPKIIQQAVIGSKEEQSEEEIHKRTDTLISVIVTALQITIIFGYIVMVLTEFNLNVTAILTGAGVLGLAVGFGAQSLVKDIIAGLFVIMENQYRKGDTVRIADKTGIVEQINLRRTILRDQDGVIHIVPNGEIRVASNYTKQFSRVNLNISVSYDTDLEKAMAVINKIGKELAEDPAWKSVIISPPKALRVEQLGDSGIDIKVLGDTKAAKQADVAGEFRLRLKKAFDKEGIEIPWPHTKVYFGNTPPEGKIKDKK
jgi:small-conductance mechanosensitive channel